MVSKRGPPRWGWARIISHILSVGWEPFPRACRAWGRKLESSWHRAQAASPSRWYLNRGNFQITESQRHNNQVESFYFLYFLLINFYWNIVALQCCVNFYCTVIRISYVCVCVCMCIIYQMYHISPCWICFPCKSPQSAEWAFLMAHMLKNLPAMWETQVWSLGQEDPLEKGMATHSSILAWRIPWTEEPGRLQTIGSQRVGHDWMTTLSLSFFQSIE